MVAEADIRARGKLFVRLALLFLLLLLAALLWARPALRAVRSWRVASLADKAEAAMGRQAWDEAFEKAAAAHRLQPQSPRGIRVLAHLHTTAGDTNALAFWQKLRATGKATMGDRRDFIRAALRFGEVAEVRSEVFKLASEPPLQPENLRVAAEYCLFTGDFTNAFQFTRALTNAEPGAVSELLMAQVLLTARSR